MIERHYTLSGLAAFLDIDREVIKEATARGDLLPVRIGRSVRYAEAQALLWARNPFASHATRIYFIQEGDDGPIKIGRGRDPWLRLVSHQSGNPRKLRLLGSLVGVVTDERAIHVRFADIRVHNEWFAPTPDLVAFIVSKVSAMDTERTSVGR